MGRGDLRERILPQPAGRDKSLADAAARSAWRCIQLCTYDGTVYNVRKGAQRIGHLCDCVLWDEAWIGYNAFHPLFHDHSRCGSRIFRRMAGLFSTQRAQTDAGFSQASQIRKRDDHLRGQKRSSTTGASMNLSCSTRLDLAVLPLFASLDVNAKIHEGKASEMLWDRCIALTIGRSKEAAQFSAHFARAAGAGRRTVVLRPVRARPRERAQLGPYRRRDRRAWESLPPG